MKKLICAKDVEAMRQDGEKCLYVDADTLITPSARDELRSAGIEIIRKEYAANDNAQKSDECLPRQSCVGSKEESCGEIDKEMIYRVLAKLITEGMLSFEQLKNL